MKEILRRELLSELLATEKSLVTETTAPDGPSFIKHSSSLNLPALLPYLVRQYWLLGNSRNQFLLSLDGEDANWTMSPDDIPADQRFISLEGAMSRWTHLWDREAFKADGLKVLPVFFYAHRNTPHFWCSR